MKSESVTKAWEVARDTILRGYKEPISKAMHELDEHVASIEAENAKQRELLKNALTYIEYEGCGVECPEPGHGATLTPCDTCNRYETESCAYVIAQSAREQGIEVDK